MACDALRDGHPAYKGCADFIRPRSAVMRWHNGVTTRRPIRYLLGHTRHISRSITMCPTSVPTARDYAN